VHPGLQAIANGRLGVFTSQDAVANGHTIEEIRAALGSGRWLRLRKGVYTTREAMADADSRQRHLLHCLAVLLSLRPGPVLSHASAARFHRLVLPRAIDAEVRVTDTVQWRSGRGYRVARASLPSADVVPWQAFGATSVARTLVDCGREWSQLDTVIAMDAALYGGLVARRELHEAVLAARNRPGIAGAARAYGLSDGRAESPLETKGRLAVLAAGLPAFEPQVELHDERGFVARVDGWYDEAAVALEFDGRVKYLDPRGERSAGQVLWEEKRREDRIRALDVQVVRLADEDLGAPWPRILRELERLMGRRPPGPRRFTLVRKPEPGADRAA
jgi:hypothetical protein